MAPQGYLLLWAELTRPDQGTGELWEQGMGGREGKYGRERRKRRVSRRERKREGTDRAGETRRDITEEALEQKRDEGLVGDRRGAAPLWPCGPS